MTWNTPDNEATVAELKARGVVFEEYDTEEVKTIDGVATLGQRAVSEKYSEHVLVSQNYIS